MIQPQHRRWLQLVSALLATVAFVAAAEHWSPQAPGLVGSVYQQNVEQDIEATALFYTESGDVGDYLDVERGKYARGGVEPD